MNVVVVVVAVVVVFVQNLWHNFGPEIKLVRTDRRCQLYKKEVMQGIELYYYQLGVVFLSLLCMIKTNQLIDRDRPTNNHLVRIPGVLCDVFCAKCYYTYLLQITLQHYLAILVLFVSGFAQDMVVTAGEVLQLFVQLEERDTKPLNSPAYTQRTVQGWQN